MGMDVDLEAVGRAQRRELMAFISEDDGKSWSKGLMIDERNPVSYPDAQQTDDGNIHLIWDYSRSKEQEIWMATFREEDVLAASEEAKESGITSLAARIPGAPQMLNGLGEPGALFPVWPIRTLGFVGVPASIELVMNLTFPSPISTWTPP
jgi:hypothetical protein